MVTVATYAAQLTPTQRHEVATYERAFDRLQAHALRGPAATEMINTMLDKIEKSRAIS